MKLLWIGKQATDGRAGDEVFDRQMVRALHSLGCEIVQVAPAASWLGRACGIARGMPHNRALFDTTSNRRAIQLAAVGCDGAIISWEPFDCFASALNIPLVTILHNVTSQSLVSARPGNRLASVLAYLARNWEQRCYSAAEPLVAVAVLSKADEALIRDVRRGLVIYAPPGMPPISPLADEAEFRREIVLEGTFDWAPKLRDLRLFAEECASLPRRLTIRAAQLPKAIAGLLHPNPEMPQDSAIRVGIITDRFQSGYKLKSSAYIAQNCIVLTYADIIDEFASIPDAHFFVRRIRHAAEIESHLDEIANVRPTELCRRLTRFQSACAELFSWRRSAERILKPLRAIAG